MHPYRTHSCSDIRLKNQDQIVRLSGWVHRKRHHGQLLFIDLRDHYGLTQIVIDQSNDLFSQAEKLHLESVITVEGKVVARDKETVNSKLPTGDVEIQAHDLYCQSSCDPLPMPVFPEQEYSEEIRLKYRYLDLRREKIHQNMVLRSQVISHLRQAMIDQGFLEMQTPILTASSPEGARDFIIPSRLHPGQFYALPQAPQQFKQLLMVSGFDKYFQIAPCFRDEDARADRSPGEFYQLDMEMAFATQDDVFNVIEPVLHHVFETFSAKDCFVSPYPFERLSFEQAMEKYGSDKPDLRNPLVICDVTAVFENSEFSLFAQKISQENAIVRAIVAPGASHHPRSFFDKLNQWARDEGQGGLGYIAFEKDGTPKGPIGKKLSPQQCQQLQTLTQSGHDDAIFFVCNGVPEASKFAGVVREKVCDALELRNNDGFHFCWVVDFPMFEKDEKTGKIDFSHNPFSMPQGGMQALNEQDPLDIKAWQYDIICNGVELSSGAIRNHQPEIMEKAFQIAGYDQQALYKKFGGLIEAFHFGAPPHGGCAPGIDRIIMLLANEPNIREVIAFPMTQNAIDLMMRAPSHIDESVLNELQLQIKSIPKLSKT